MTVSSLILFVDSHYSHTLHYKNWDCTSAEGNAELQSLLKKNKSLQQGGKGYIGYVVPAFTTDGNHILPSQLKMLPGMIVEVSAFVSHKVLVQVQTDWTTSSSTSRISPFLMIHLHQLIPPSRRDDS